MYMIFNQSQVLVQTTEDIAWLRNIGVQMTLDELIRTLLNTAISLAAVVAVTYLIIGGFKYIMSSGDKAKTEEAQKSIGDAIIGLLVCLSAVLIVDFVLLKLFGIEPQSLSSVYGHAIG